MISVNKTMLRISSSAFLGVQELFQIFRINKLKMFEVSRANILNNVWFVKPISRKQKKL